MVFSSTTFLFYFLPTVFLTIGLGYLTLRPFLGKKGTTKFVNLFLLIFSLIFYYWGEGDRTWVLISSMLITFGSGLLIEYGTSQKNHWISKAGLSIGLSANLGMLLWFKYSNFGLNTIYNISEIFGSSPSKTLREIALPLGISFYSFQSISYIIDLYRKKTEAARNPLAFGCYITFFPQLVAGPIVRFKDIQKELKSRNIDLSSLTEGISRFIIGLSKKVLIANPTGRLADELFATNPQDLSTVGCWLAAISYGIQIFFDFSGYSDMAIGLARIFGIRIPENFKRPYQSSSVRQFWRSWHISLSTWFRDYLYIPLGGSRNGNLRTFTNLTLVFVGCGLWHGASLNFVLWGLFHGLFLSSEHFFKSNKPTPIPIGRIYTLTVVTASWILFRSDSLRDAFDFYEQMFFKFEGFRETNLPLIIYSWEIQLAVSAGITLSLINVEMPICVANKPWFIAIKRITLVALLAISSTYIAISSHNPFIYFRF